MFLANLYHAFPKIQSSSTKSSANGSVTSGSNATGTPGSPGSLLSYSSSNSSSNLLRSEEYAELIEDKEAEKREERGNFIESNIVLMLILILLISLAIRVWI